MIKLKKYHSLGNDYWVLHPKDAPEVPNAQWIQKLCHRHFGLGSDGLLYGPLDDQYTIRIFNPDGSEAEKSGNGCRIFARYLYDAGLFQANQSYTLSTPGGPVNIILTERGESVRVGMGHVSFSSSQIPMLGPERLVLNETLIINDERIIINAASVGNPHCVYFANTPLNRQWIEAFGPKIENHPFFPNRTNVQVAYIKDKKTLQIEIWERGAGYTLASGSSATATAAIAYKLGYIESKVTVMMPGGNLFVEIMPDYFVTQTGPVTYIGSAEYISFF